MSDLKAGFERERPASGTASFSTSPAAGEEGEEVFAVACRVIKRTWRGWGNDVEVGVTQPEYTGGTHFGSDNESDDSDGEDEDDDEPELGEEDEMKLAEELELGELVVCGPSGHEDDA